MKEFVSVVKGKVFSKKEKAFVLLAAGMTATIIFCMTWVGLALISIICGP